MAAVYTSILNAVVSGIQSLNLNGIPSSNVVTRKLASDRKTVLPVLPGIVVAPYGSKAPSLRDGSNLRDDIPYGVVVIFLSASDQDLSVNQDRQLQWTESVQSKFRFQRLSGVDSVWICEVTNDLQFDPTMFFQGNVDASWIGFRFKSREARG